MTQGYTYPEPDVETREVYLDSKGNPHLDRDTAINASVRYDFETELRCQLIRAFPDHPDERDFMARVLAGQLVARHSPLGEMVRKLIEEAS